MRSEENFILYDINTVDKSSVAYVLFCSETLNNSSVTDGVYMQTTVAVHMVGTYVQGHVRLM